MKRMGFATCATFIAFICQALPATAQPTNYTQGFDDVSGIFSTGGWVFENLSNPPPESTSPTGFWAQGVPAEFGDNAQAGPANSFITATFESGSTAMTGSAVSDWLLTPELTFENGSVISFYTEQGHLNTTFPNRLQVRLSLDGGSTDVGTQPPAIGSVQPSFGDFTTLLADINPTYLNPPTPGAYPTTWTQESFTISGLSAPATGRIGFLYLLTDNAVQGSQIGIDSFVLTTVPEPPQFALLTVSGLAFVLIGLPKSHPARRIASVAPSALASFQLTFPRPRKLSLGYPRSRLRR
jgi:hypothetical protein